MTFAGLRPLTPPAIFAYYVTSTESVGPFSLQRTICHNYSARLSHYEVIKGFITFN